MRRHRFPRLVLLSTALTLLGGTVHAELKWDTLELAAPIHADQAVANVAFPFVNSGDNPCTITNVKAGCSCTIPALEKTTFAPGERGEIHLAYHPGNREGQHRVETTVTTDGGATYTLTLLADIEALVGFDTRYVFWQGAEARTPKHLHLTFAAGHDAAVQEIISSDPRFTITFAPVGDSGREYDIVVTPPAEVLNYTVITVRTHVGAEQTPRDFHLVARTMPAPATAAQP